MHCTVLRPFPGPDGMIEAGQVVDTSAWRKRNVDVLIGRKYLREEPTYGLTQPEPESLDDEPEYRAGRTKRARV